MRRVAAAGKDLAVYAASPDAKQALGNVMPTILKMTMRDFNMIATLASVLLREQFESKYEVFFFSKTRESNIAHDRSIKQSGKDSPSLVMKKMARTLHHKLKKRKKEEVFN